MESLAIHHDFDGNHANVFDGRDSTLDFTGALVNSLRMLFKAHQYARDARHLTWDFAIEIKRLRDTGLSECELRWLVCKDFVEHAGEITLPGQQGRSFRPLSGLTFLGESCFVLTEKGVSFVERLDRMQRQSPNGRSNDDWLAAGRGTTGPVIPFWNASLLELKIGEQLVKRYRVPAPNQEAVLAAFQEEEWPTRIDDPLVPAADIHPKRRLHSTIQCLNRNQQRRMIHFSGDGHGTGICWELVG